MAAYFGLADVTTYVNADTIALLTDDDEDGLADDVVLTKLYADVTADIGAALLAAGYVVPVAAPGAFLASLGGRLSLAALYGRRPNVQAPTTVEAVWTHATEQLKAIAKSELGVPEAVSAGGAAYAGGMAASSDTDRGWDEAEV